MILPVLSMDFTLYNVDVYDDHRQYYDNIDKH